MNARTAGKLRRTVVLGGRAVFPAALSLVLASPGAAWAVHDGGAWSSSGSADHVPAVVIAAPAEGSTFRVGVPVTLRAEVDDSRAALARDSLRWTVVRHTGEESETVAEGVGAAATFTPSDRLGADTSYEVRLRVSGMRGHREDTSVTIVPETVRLTLRSDPEGAALLLGGRPATTSTEFEEPIGRRLELAAAASHSPLGGWELVFDGWSDGGSREREYVIPEVPTELVASYRAPQVGTGPEAESRSAPAPTPTPAPRVALGSPDGAPTSLPIITSDVPAPFATRSLTGWLRNAGRGMRVQVALRRGSGARGCGWWVRRNAHFSRASRKACGRPRWMTASVRRRASDLRWKVRLGGRLPKGRYAFAVRVLDAHGLPVAVEHG